MGTDKENLFLYGEKLIEFFDLYGYNNEYNLMNSKTDMNSSIWRYMDFSKFVALLNSNTLYLSKPKHFKDPFEGAFSEKDLINILGEPPTYIPDIKMDYDAYREKYIKKYRSLLEFVAVSCWHMNEVESAAMWDLYLSSNEGIAIKTTIDGLYESLNDYKYVFPGKVKYIDYHTEMASKNVFETLFYKRQSFKHEQELRLIVLEDEGKPRFEEAGIGLSIDLNKMIKEIYIHPTAPEWFFQTVKGLMERYELNKPIKQSKLYSGPSMVW